MSLVSFRPALLSAASACTLTLTLGCGGPPVNAAAPRTCAATEREPRTSIVAPSSVQISRDTVQLLDSDLSLLASRANLSPEQLASLGLSPRRLGRAELVALIANLSDDAEDAFLRRDRAGELQGQWKATPQQMLRFARDEFGPTIRQQFSFLGDASAYDEFVSAASMAIDKSSSSDAQRAFFYLSRAETAARARQSAREICRAWLLEKLAQMGSEGMQLVLDVASLVGQPVLVSQRGYALLDNRQLELTLSRRDCNPTLNACRFTFDASAGTTPLRELDDESNIIVKLLVNGSETETTLPVKYMGLSNAPQPE